MTEDQLTTLYFAGALAQIIYTAIKMFTTKKGDEQVRWKMARDEMTVRGLPNMWPLFTFIFAMVVIFWPIHMAQKVWKMTKRSESK